MVKFCVKKRSALVKMLLFCLIFPSPVLSQTISVGCPPCHYDYPPPTGHGTADDGRIRLNVYIDPSWQIDANGTPTPNITNVNVWNAVNGCDGCQNLGAINSWNAATALDGQRTPYKLVLTGDPSQADIKIKREDNCEIIIGNCADINKNSGEVRMCVSYRSFDSIDIEASVKHEVGHFMGLAHISAPGSCTEGTPTIMRGHEDCVPIVKEIRARDVGEVRNHHLIVMRVVGNAVVAHLFQVSVPHHLVIKITTVALMSPVVAIIAGMVVEADVVTLSCVMRVELGIRRCVAV
jgi:hypothetical protein